MSWKCYLIVATYLLLASCADSTDNKKAEKKVVEKVNYYERGAEISAIAQAELMRSVKKALEEGGPGHAIEFCNVHATPLADSLSKKFDCNIGRLALKNRNPANYPIKKEEILLLNTYLENSFEKKTLNDTLLAMNGKLIYYRPIFLAMDACLKCHGQVGIDINNETMSVLDKLYPEDKATNYRLGEFRGAWQITFNLE